MSQERRAPDIIIHAGSAHSEDDIADDTSSQGEYDESTAGETEAGWHNRSRHGHRDDIEPSDSASAHAEYSGAHIRPTHYPLRQHSVQRARPHRQHSYPVAVPTPPVGSHAMSAESDFYGGPYGHAPPPGARYPPYDRYAPSAPYAPASHHPYAAQMVPWGAQPGHPFAAQPHSGFYERHDVVPFQHPTAAYPYGAPGAMVPPNWYPPPPPATEVGRPQTPAPPEDHKTNPEFLMMKQQLEALTLERKKADEAAARAELEQKIRAEQETKLKQQMEATRIAQEDAKKEIELARIAADAAARERLEEARKAEEERRRMEAELRAQVAREERERIEAERKAEAQRAADQAAALEKAERDAREKYEKAKIAEAESKAEMARQKELIEIETKNKLLAEQQALQDAKAAAEAKAAEAAKQLEVERETLKQKAIQDYEEKMAKDKKDIADKEQAAAAAKQQAHDEFVLKQAKEKQDAADAAAAAEKAKKDAEDLKKQILEEGKKAAEEEAKKATGDEKEPIKFKDAVGRKFSFPWKLASKWESMELLIEQAFAHIEGVGPHVREGHYDLEGPEGELILKNDIWNSTVQPGWQITMKMWPAEQMRSPPRQFHIPSHIPREHRDAYMQRVMQEQRAMRGQHGGMRAGPMPGPGVPPIQGRPPNFAPFGAAGRAPPVMAGMTPGIVPVDPRGGQKERRKSRSKQPSGWSQLFGTQAKRSSSKKKK